VSGLASSTEYRFKLKACKKTDTDTYWSDFSDECAGATIFGQVANLQAETESASEIALTWELVEQVSGYQIYRLNTSTGKYVKVATIRDGNTLTYTDTGLSAGKEYTYKVRAYLAGDAANYYGSFSQTSAATTKPAKVTGLKASTKSSSVTLTWSKVTGASGYQIYRLNKKTGKYEKLATVKSSVRTYKNTKLKKGTAYTYKVRAYRTYGGSNYFGSFSTTKKITAK
jgi:fibronectin type 3 domain-containing protein